MAGGFLESQNIVQEGVFDLTTGTQLVSPIIEFGTDATSVLQSTPFGPGVPPGAGRFFAFTLEVDNGTFVGSGTNQLVIEATPSLPEGAPDSTLTLGPGIDLASYTGPVSPQILIRIVRIDTRVSPGGPNATSSDLPAEIGQTGFLMTLTGKRPGAVPCAELSGTATTDGATPDVFRAVSRFIAAGRARDDPFQAVLRTSVERTACLSRAAATNQTNVLRTAALIALPEESRRLRQLGLQSGNVVYSLPDAALGFAAADVARAAESVGADAFHPGVPSRGAADVAHVLHVANASWRRWCAAGMTSAATAGVPALPSGERAVAHIIHDAGPAHLGYVHHPATAPRAGGAVLTHVGLRRVPIMVCAREGAVWHGEVDVRLRTPFLASNAICTSANCAGDGWRCGDITITGYVPYWQPSAGLGAAVRDVGAELAARTAHYTAAASAPRGLSTDATGRAWVAHLEDTLRTLWHRRVLRAPYPEETELSALPSRVHTAAATAVRSGTALRASSSSGGLPLASVCTNAQPTAHDGGSLAFPAGGAARGRTCGAEYPVLCNAPCLPAGKPGYVFDLPAGGLCCPAKPTSAQSCPDGGNAGLVQAMHPAFLVDQLADNQSDKGMQPIVSPACATGLGNTAAAGRGTPYGWAHAVGCIKSPQFSCGDIFGALGVPAADHLEAAWQGKLVPLTADQGAQWSTPSTAGTVQWCLAGSEALPSATGQATYQPQGDPRTRVGLSTWAGPFMDTPLPLDSPIIQAAANVGLRQRFGAALVPSADRTVVSSACGTAVGRTSLITCPGDAQFLALTGAVVSALSDTGKPATASDPAQVNCTLSVDCVAKVGLLVGHDACKAASQAGDNPAAGTLWGTAPFLEITFTADIPARVYYRTNFRTDNRNIAFSDMALVPLGTASIIEATMALGSYDANVNPLVPVTAPQSGSRCVPNACVQFSTAPLTGAAATTQDNLWTNLKNRFLVACGALEASFQLGSMATGLPGAPSVETAIATAARAALGAFKGFSTDIYIAAQPR